MLGVGDPNPATQAEHTVAVPVLNQSGSLAIGSTLVRTETQVVYQTIAAVALTASTVNVTMRAVSGPDGTDGSGAIGNLEPGDIVSFANTPANVATEATVVAQTLTGEDAESEDAYRARVLRRTQARPQGGAYADYEAWATEVEGIAAAYVYTSDNPGEVDIYIEATQESSGSEDGIPTSAQVDEVVDNINLDLEGKATRRPAGAAINVSAITRTGFSVTITGLLPDTDDTRNAIEEGIDEYLRARRPFIVGLSVLPREDRVTTGAIAGIAHEIAAAEGASITDVEMTPGPSYTLEHGELAKLASTVWT
jgi:uncharacterized phage protein gp47/JayE